MKGDALASGAKSATFTVGKPRFSEEEQKRDLAEMSEGDYRSKYLVTGYEYQMLKNPAPEGPVSDFQQDVSEAQRALKRLEELDAQQAKRLSRECFISPRVGSLIVDQDQSNSDRHQTQFSLPKTLRAQIMKERKEHELMPTTGHVIKCGPVSENDAIIGEDGHIDYVMKWHDGRSLEGLRILFGPMSGTPILFTGHPTWRLLEYAEIMGVIPEDVEIQDEVLEPLV